MVVQTRIHSYVICDDLVFDIHGWNADPTDPSVKRAQAYVFNRSNVLLVRHGMADMPSLSFQSYCHLVEITVAEYKEMVRDMKTG